MPLQFICYKCFQVASILHPARLQLPLETFSTHHKLVRSTSTMARSDTFLDILGFSLLTDIEQQKSIFYVAFVALVTVALWVKLTPALGLGVQVAKGSIVGQSLSSYHFPKNMVCSGKLTAT